MGLGKTYKNEIILYLIYLGVFIAVFYSLRWYFELEYGSIFFYNESEDEVIAAILIIAILLVFFIAGLILCFTNKYKRGGIVMLVFAITYIPLYWLGIGTLINKTEKPIREYFESR